ncbi:N-terminal kinase-like protein, partial [Tetrabaena socialis]
RSLRRSLLETIDGYSQHLTTSVIEEQIYPQLQTGFNDSHAYIRELTLKSMLALAPKMSNKTLVTSVLKHLSKLQVDEEPSIRANTTVLLGSVAPLLGDATCRRVLLNAFTRALKDAFPPARIAGLRALVATKQYYSPGGAGARRGDRGGS